jgi:hypothetical protein
MSAKRCSTAIALLFLVSPSLVDIGGAIGATVMVTVFVTLTYTNTSVSTIANVPTTIDASSRVNTVLEITTNTSVTNGSINITECALNLSGTNQLTVKTPLNYLRITASDEIEQSMTRGAIKVYYLDSELERNNLDENTLRGYRWNGRDWELVANSGVNAGENYVWIVVDRLSDYAIGGDTIPVATPSPPSEGVYSPIILAGEGIQRLVVTADGIKDLIRQFRYMSRSFFAAPTELAGILGALDYVPVPLNMAEAINDVLIKPVQEIVGDAYTLAEEHSVKKFRKSERVIIARGDLGVDSMASVTYAKALNVPILLVEPGAIPESTADALEKLETQSVTIVGGPVAVSEEVEKRLPNASRIFGQNRHETAVRIAEALMAQTEVDTLVITDGINPDLIAVMVASKYGAPIVYTEGDDVPSVTEEFLRKKEFKRIVMVGVTDAAALQVKLIKATSSAT